MSNALAEQFYNQLLTSDRWSAQQMQTHQREQLARLVSFARAHVPFYRNRLDALFARDGEVDWESWHGIPVLTRDDLGVHGAALTPDALPPGHGPTAEFITSGTTGVPVSVVSSALASLADRSVYWRAQHAHHVDWSQVNCVRGERAPTTGNRPWGPSWLTAAQQGHSVFLDRTCPPQETLNAIVQSGARYLNAGPRTLNALATDARILSILPQMHVIFCHGDRVEEEDRVMAREVFGATLLEAYSSKEGHQMAHACPEYGTLHLNAEIALVEILGPDNLPCRPGQEGRVVVTPFYNAAQPLIRYEQGDKATLLPGCPCGRASPAIRISGARRLPFFHHPDGRKRAQSLPNEARGALGVSKWQVAQTGPLDFEFRYVAENPRLGCDEHALERLFRRTYFSDARLKIIALERFEPGPGDKHAEYTQEWRDN